MNDLDHSRFETWQRQQQAIAQKREALLQLFAVFLRDCLALADRLLERSAPVEPDPPAAPARRAPVPRPWTAEEDAILRRHPRMNSTELSRRLMGRSVDAINNRRARIARHRRWGGATRKPKQEAARDPPQGEPCDPIALARVRTDLVVIIGLAVAKRLEARAEHRAAIRKRIHDFDSVKPPNDERRACMLHLLDLELARREETERMEPADV